MSQPFIILLVGLLYVLLVGGLALFRREGLSMRFALESAGIAVLGSSLAVITGFSIGPVLFLIVLYLITMRVRLLIDLANVFARQGKHAPAEFLYNLASRLWPDAAGSLILKVNQATLYLQENRFDESIATFLDVLEQAGQGYLGVKYEAVAHFNLGVAYQRRGMDARAIVEFNAAIDSWPGSLYARHAEAALERHRKKITPLRIKAEIETDFERPQRNKKSQ